jgi:hypothetical protein
LQGKNFDQNLGIQIIRTAITKPARTIIENAGEEGSVIVGKILDQHADNFNFGYDAATGNYTDMIQAGILDPLKVVKTALLDASGVASLLTTSEACIVEAPKEEAAAPSMPGGGGMGPFSVSLVTQLMHSFRWNGWYVLEKLTRPCTFRILLHAPLQNKQPTLSHGRSHANLRVSSTERVMQRRPTCCAMEPPNPPVEEMRRLLVNHGSSGWEGSLPLAWTNLRDVVLTCRSLEALVHALGLRNWSPACSY